MKHADGQTGSRLPVARQAASVAFGFATLRIVVLTVVALTWLVNSADAQQSVEARSLAIIDAIENVVSDAIARAEASMASIACVRRGGGDGVLGPLDPLDPRRRQLAIEPPVGPDDPEFVPTAFGTGVVIDRQGLILTNYHVLGDPELFDYYVTTIDRQKLKARVWSADPRFDLAVLKIETSDLQPIQWGDASTLRRGHLVIALGNPYAIASDGQVSASWGIVANLMRKAPRTPAGTTEDDAVLGPTLHEYGTLIQTDARLNLGTSGGALLNKRGEMVGLTTSIAAIAGYEKSAGYAVAIDDTFRRVVEALKARREVEYGFLGIEPDNLMPDEIRSGLRGMRVNRVLVGTPAQHSDLRPGDVITAVNDVPIFDADGLVLQIGKQPVDSIVRLTVSGEGNRDVRIVEVRLAKYPVRGRSIYQPRDKWRGLLVDYKTVTIDEPVARPTPVEDAVVVIDVDSDSPAWQAGFRRGMFITHVDGRSVRTPDQFYTRVRDKQRDVELRLPFGSDGDLTRTVRPAG